MSEKQLKAFLEAVKANAGLQEKLKGASDLDAAVAIAKEAGFDVTPADLPNEAQSKQVLEISDEEGLEGGVVGGGVAGEVDSGMWRGAIF